MLPYTCASVYASDDKIYVVGGLDHDDQPTTRLQVYSQLELYQPKIFKVSPHLRKPRVSPEVCVAYNHLFVYCDNSVEIF